MILHGPIVIVDDDPDEHYLIREAFYNFPCTCRIVCFAMPEEALDYLKRDDVEPFLIISDVNMPRITGLQFRRMILEDAALARKCSPFVFLTNDGSEGTIQAAYALSAQGFFTKPADFDRLVDMLSAIVSYWQLCAAPV